MSTREVVFAVAVVSLGLAGMAGIAATGGIVGTALQAEAVGFDVLADHMLNGKACTATETQ